MRVHSFSSIILGLCAIASQARPQAPTPNLPVLEFPSGSYRASRFDAASSVYVFKNIRFGAPPVGDLRFRKPSLPSKNTTVSDGSYGPQCVQTLPSLGGIGGGSPESSGSEGNRQRHARSQRR